MASVSTVATLLAAAALCSANPILAMQPAAAAEPGQSAPDQSNRAPICEPSHLDSPYIPVDSWIYPAVWRLYALGYVDTVFLSVRPWTRTSLEHMLEGAAARIQNENNSPAGDEAQGIYDSLMRELHADITGPCLRLKGSSRIESIYSVARGISGTPLTDSYHLGSSVINDYGRPFENGVNSYSGVSGYASAGRFLIYARGEFQGARAAAGYSSTLANQLTAIDGDAYYLNTKNLIPLNLQATLPAGPIAAVNNGRIIEAYASANLLGHEISFGKQDDWLGPGLGGGMAYSNNAENIYSIRINRVEPLHIPLLSKIIGPFRYEFIAGPLKGHTYPIDPWVHSEDVSFRPTQNLEFSFQRTVIWGGRDHEPINLHTFLRSFFSTSAPDSGSVKNSPQDPGARFAAFNFSYRLPFVRNWLTLYSDSEVHDEVSPADAPRRASWRPGIYLSHFPGVSKLDLRAEGVSTDPPVSRSVGGHFMYYEGIEKQGYTNAGQLFGDWIGREDKGGQAWVTYHLSGNQWIQSGVRVQKAAKDFIPGGTTLEDINFQVVKRIGRDFEINGKFAFEHWNAPIYLPGIQTVTVSTFQLTWFPSRKVSF